MFCDIDDWVLGIPTIIFDFTKKKNTHLKFPTKKTLILNPNLCKYFQNLCIVDSDTGQNPQARIIYTP